MPTLDLELLQTKQKKLEEAYLLAERQLQRITGAIAVLKELIAIQEGKPSNDGTGS